jgi:centromere protein I
MSLFAASRTPAKGRTKSLSVTVEEICEHAYQFGLPNEGLTKIVNLIATKTELDQSSVTAIIKNMYPAEPVSSQVVVTVVGALGQGGKKKPSTSTHAALVKWLAAIHEVVEDHSILLRFYAVLFNLLDMITIR